MAKNKRQRRRAIGEAEQSSSILLALMDVPIDEFERVLAEHDIDEDLRTQVIAISQEEAYSHRCLKIVRTSAGTSASFSCNFPADPDLGDVSRSGRMVQFEWTGTCWQDNGIILEFGG